MDFAALMVLASTTYTLLPEQVNVTILPVGVAIGGMVGALLGWSRDFFKKVPAGLSFLGAVYGTSAAAMLWLYGLLFE